MDLQAAMKLGGRQSYLTKIAALLCFLIAGVLLVISLLGSQSRAGASALSPPAFQIGLR